MTDVELPKRIDQNDVVKLIGESAYWFCPACHEWRTTSIRPNGIVCPVCMGTPDWEKHPPTLAYESRYRRVVDLCAEDSPWRKWADGMEQKYGEFIEVTYRGMPARTKQTGWRYFAHVWKEVDKLGDYLLAAPDIPICGIPYAYSEDGLRRRYYDPRRASNVVSLSELMDDNGACFTYDTAEAASYTAGYRHQFDDKQVGIVEYLEGIFDPMERGVARDLSEGYTKRDIERRYGLSERRVRTIVSHIEKSLNRV